MATDNMQRTTTLDDAARRVVERMAQSVRAVSRDEPSTVARRLEQVIREAYETLTRENAGSPWTSPTADLELHHAVVRAAGRALVDGGRC